MEDKEIQTLLKKLERREREYVKRNGHHSAYNDLGYLKDNGKAYTIEELKSIYGDRYAMKIYYLNSAVSNNRFLRDQDHIFKQNALDIAEAMGDIEMYDKILHSSYKQLRRMVQMGEINVFEQYKSQTEGYSEAYEGEWKYNKKLGRREYSYKTDKKGNPILKKSVTGIAQAKIRVKKTKRLGL